ncbi:MAG: DUF4364 family protein [Clostridia bacterium]|nr:DUF4364 family protein [Clostridia bacterium]
MEHDAISAGVSKIGGLFSTADVRILICYILSSINKPINGTMLCEVLHAEGIANIFEVSDSLAFLTESGHIIEHDDGTFTVNDSGRHVANTLNTNLSSIVKDRAYAAVLKMLIRIRNAKETDFKISREDDRIFLTCSALDQDRPFMSIKLMLSDEDQAIFIKNKFLENTSKIYSTLLEMLTKD